MFKILKVALISTLFMLGLNANDFLFKATGGVLNDNAAGIKKLDDKEMKEIIGGYKIIVGNLSENEAIAMAQPDFINELGFVFTPDGSLDLTATRFSDKGLCSMGSTECFYNQKTKSHLQLNKNRMQEFQNGFVSEYNYLYHNLGYYVKREIKVERGIRYPLFTYGVVAYNRLTGGIGKINSSAVLNNNMIIRELRDAYKERLESRLGGWTVR